MTTTRDLDFPQIPSDFAFTEDHELARQSARRFITGHAPIERLRRFVDEREGYDLELYRKMAELGWVGLVASESHGGAGLDSLHQALLFEELGRQLLPSPLLGSVLALTALEAAGSHAQQAKYLPDIIEGQRIATLCVSEPGGSWEPEHVDTLAKPSGKGFVVSGKKTHVVDAVAAQLAVVPARVDGAVGLFVVELDQAGVTLEPEGSVDLTRKTARVSLDAAPAERLEGDGLAALRASFRRGWMLLAAEMVGAAEAVLAKTREYAAERKQFGRAIGSFQAVKHPIVDMMIGIELSRSLALAAAVALDNDPARAEVAARMAKAHASDTLAYAVKKGVQLHGGFGFTWDCDVHLYFKRLLWARGTLGDAIHHRRHLAGVLFE